MPGFVTFNGKRAFKEVFSYDPEYVLADEVIGESFVFVLPSSSGMDTSMNYQEKLDWYKKQNSLLRSSN